MEGSMSSGSAIRFRDKEIDVIFLLISDRGGQWNNQIKIVFQIH
jgi:hypothetical protein